MKILKGKKKSTIIDVKDEELQAMRSSFITDTQMMESLISLDDDKFEANVNIPEGGSVKQIRSSIEEKIKYIKPMIDELNQKLLGNES